MFSQLRNYDAYLDPDFKTMFERARRLIRLAKKNAIRPISGSASRLDRALDIEDQFNRLVLNLSALNRTGHCGILPAVKENGIPIAAVKHFSNNGWIVTIVLDVPQSRAHYIYIEPDDPTREILNMLTDGRVGP